MKISKYIKYYSINQRFCKKFGTNIYSQETYIYNKDFASKFRNEKCFKDFYDKPLLSLTNSLFVITKKLETIVFVGPNPEIFLEKFPPSK